MPGAEHGRDRSRSLAARLDGALFRLTTRRMGPRQLRALELQPLADRVRAQGWQIRSAGPRWFTVWSGDAARLAQESTLLLPAPWIGLTEPEMLAILTLQAQRQGLLPADSGWLGPLIQSGRSKLWLAQRSGA
ncbi:hypothetical protein [Paracoccus siganidrum]|uniref:Uncharacterized protein n=1 Tax=Paracoccus siganidrum TaxID=1276757 RepID=A0A419AAF6_9RHOB|nr:hypothetical protein [Paracoccus siganidrum]RJL19925.1 hypothetical protein D3P05_04185 [Paracoccus siganidrum]RMC35118.1 hypothetical protein C9E82_10925 [Paracoccus siganidrum]